MGSQKDSRRIANVILLPSVLGFRLKLLSPTYIIEIKLMIIYCCKIGTVNFTVWTVKSSFFIKADLRLINISYLNKSSRNQELFELIMVGLSARSEGSEPCSIPYFVSGNTAMDEGGRRREDVDDKGKGSSNEYIAGGRCRKINIASTIDEKLLDRESSPNICIYFTI